MYFIRPLTTLHVGGQAAGCRQCGCGAPLPCLSTLPMTVLAWRDRRWAAWRPPRRGGRGGGRRVNPGGVLRRVSGSHASGGPLPYWSLPGAGHLRQPALQRSKCGTQETRKNVTPQRVLVQAAATRGRGRPAQRRRWSAGVLGCPMTKFWTRRFGAKTLLCCVIMCSWKAYHSPSQTPAPPSRRLPVCPNPSIPDQGRGLLSCVIGHCTAQLWAM